MLAYSEAAVVDAVVAAGMVARTPRTLTTRVALLRELAAIPDRGWAVEREEGNVGVSCVAAPLFGPLGNVAAALSVTGPTALVKPTGSARRSGSPPRRPPAPTPPAADRRGQSSL